MSAINLFLLIVLFGRMLTLLTYANMMY